MKKVGRINLAKKQTKNIDGKIQYLKNDSIMLPF